MKCLQYKLCVQVDLLSSKQPCWRALQLRKPLKAGVPCCTASADAPVVDPPAEESAPGVSEIELSDNAQSVVDNLQAMSLLDLAALSQLLEDRLGVSGDGAMAAAGAVGGAMAGPAGGEAGGADAAAEEPEEQTEFTVKLDSFDAGAKIKLIKELRSVIDGLGMKEAKDMVEKAPTVIKEAIPKELADDIKAKLEALGAKVSIS